MTKLIESEDSLLCCGYALVNFKTLAIQVWRDGIPFSRKLLCAIGVLADGSTELLGVWPGTVVDEDVWQAAFLDMEVRGVESIRFVVGSDLADVGEGLRVVSFGATELPSIEQTLAVTVAQVAPRHRGAVACALRAVAAAGSSEAAEAALRAFERGQWGGRFPQIVARWRLALELWAPLFALPPALRRVVLSGDRTAANLHESLVRSVGRHGCFANQAAALDFVTNALLRAERRLDRERVIAMTEPRIHRVGPAGGQPSLGMH